MGVNVVARSFKRMEQNGRNVNQKQYQSRKSVSPVELQEQHLPKKEPISSAIIIDDDDEREEGEIIDEFEDIISSDEELSMRKRIEELEAKNAELEKIANISGVYESNYDKCNSEDYLTADQTSAAGKRLRSIVYQRKPINQPDYDREVLLGSRSRNKFQYYQQQDDILQSASHRHYYHHAHKKSRRSHSSGARKLHSKRYARTRQYSSTTDDDADDFLTRRQRGNTGPDFFDHYDSNSDVLDEADDPVCYLNRDELRFALARNGAAHKSSAPAVKESKDCGVYSSTRGTLKERLRKSQRNVTEGTVSTEIDCSEQMQHETVPVIDLEDIASDDSMSLEEQELRLIALKSAVMKKHIARQKRNAEAASAAEATPYSPSDFDEIIAAKTSLIVEIDDIEDECNSMEISPVTSPKNLFDDDSLSKTNNEIDTKPIDMDIAHSDSDEEFPIYVGHNNKWIPIEQIPLPSTRDVQNTYAPTPLRYQYSPAMIPTVEMNELPPPPPPFFAKSEQQFHREDHHQENNNTKQEDTNEEEEEEALRALLLSKLNSPKALLKKQRLPNPSSNNHTHISNMKRNSSSPDSFDTVDTESLRNFLLTSMNKRATAKLATGPKYPTASILKEAVRRLTHKTCSDNYTEISRETNSQTGSCDQQDKKIENLFDNQAVKNAESTYSYEFDDSVEIEQQKDENYQSNCDLVYQQTWESSSQNMANNGASLFITDESLKINTKFEVTNNQLEENVTDQNERVKNTSIKEKVPSSMVKDAFTCEETRKTNEVISDSKLESISKTKHSDLSSTSIDYNESNEQVNLVRTIQKLNVNSEQTNAECSIKCEETINSVDSPQNRSCESPLDNNCTEISQEHIYDELPQPLAVEKVLSNQQESLDCNATESILSATNVNTLRRTSQEHIYDEQPQPLAAEKLLNNQQETPDCSATECVLSPTNVNTLSRTSQEHIYDEQPQPLTDEKLLKNQPETVVCNATESILSEKKTMVSDSQFLTKPNSVLSDGTNQTINTNHKFIENNQLISSPDLKKPSSVQVQNKAQVDSQTKTMTLSKITNNETKSATAIDTNLAAVILPSLKKSTPIPSTDVIKKELSRSITRTFPVKKIVKPNKVINTNPELKRKFIESIVPLAVAVPQKILRTDLHGAISSPPALSRLVTVAQASSFTTNKLIITLRASDTETSDDESALTTESVCSDADFQTTTTSDGNLSLIVNNDYYDNASPISLQMESPCNTPTRSNSPILKSLKSEPSNESNIQLSVVNELFKVKLDEFLKTARSKVEKTSPNSNSAEPKSINDDNSPMTPVAVRHLPDASQQEYRRLINRIKMLERQKQAKKNDQKVNLDSSDAPLERTTYAVTSAAAAVVPASNSKTLIKRVLVKNAKSSSNSTTTTPAKTKSVASTEKVANQLKAVSSLETTSQSSITQKTETSARSKENVLASYETSYEKTCSGIIFNLDKSLQLVLKAKEAKMSKLRLEQRLKELRKEMEEVQYSIKQKQATISKAYPEICSSHEVIASLKQRRVKLANAATSLGRSVKGDAYRLINDQKEVILQKSRKLAAEIQNVNKMKYCDLDKLEKEDGTQVSSKTQILHLQTNNECLATSTECENTIALKESSSSNLTKKNNDCLATSSECEKTTVIKESSSSNLTKKNNDCIATSTECEKTTVIKESSSFNLTNSTTVQANEKVISVQLVPTKDVKVSETESANKLNAPSIGASICVPSDTNDRVECSVKKDIITTLASFRETEKKTFGTIPALLSTCDESQQLTCTLETVKDSDEILVNSHLNPDSDIYVPDKDEDVDPETIVPIEKKEPPHQNIITCRATNTESDKDCTSLPQKQASKEEVLEIISSQENSRDEIPLVVEDTVCSSVSNIEMDVERVDAEVDTIKKYISPLAYLKNNERQFDPNGIICPYELMGQCYDKDCKYLHFAVVDV